ncbi:MAG: NADH-quinone oxidoreductase subunit NuoK [Candidatus Eremiobacteraeota bacterium]|nr:NADH-quinone oxidoreductase subunit NuoK [Candidatus Eremiobacteraeota bacterium]
MIENPQFFLLISAFLFGIGAVGVVVRRNPLVMFMSIELMLNAANLALVTFSRFGPPSPHALGSPADGPVFAFIVMTIAAAEAVVGLAIIITIFRTRHEVDVDHLGALKG